MRQLDRFLPSCLSSELLRIPGFHFRRTDQAPMSCEVLMSMNPKIPFLDFKVIVLSLIYMGTLVCYCSPPGHAWLLVRPEWLEEPWTEAVA